MTGYFCVSGVRRYVDAPELTGVTAELRTMRRTFAALGLEEVAPLTDDDETAGERSHRATVDALEAWAARASVPPHSTIVVYATGHGEPAGDSGWRLVDAGRRTLFPERFPEAVRAGSATASTIDEVVLILDACFAQPGAEAAGRRDAELARPVEAATWSIAVSRRAEKARQRSFVRAFAADVERRGRDHPEDHHLDLARVLASVRRELRTASPAQDVRWLAAGVPTSAALPNPHWASPRIDLGLGEDWNRVVRGTTRHSGDGWYFTGRTRLLSRLGAALAEARCVVLSGAPGVGKSAVLGLLAARNGPAAREGLPAALAGRVPALAGPVHLVGGPGRRTRGDALALVRDRDHAELDGATVIVDQITDSDALGATVADLLAVPGVRVLVGARTHQVAHVPGGPTVVECTEGVPHDAQDVVDHLVRRLYGALGDPARRHAADRISAACAGHIGASLAAAEAYLSARRGSPEDDARAAAARTLQEVCRDAVAAGTGWSSHRSAEVVDVLVQTCALDEELALPSAVWAVLAGCSVSDIHRAVAGAGPFVLARPAGSGRWRPSFAPLVKGGPVPPDERVLGELTGPAPVDWSAVDESVVALVAATAHVSGSTARYRSEPGFLLHAPPVQVDALVRRLPVTERARMARVWSGLRKSRGDADRRMLLRVLAARHGARELAASCEDGPVLWSQEEDPQAADVSALASAPSVGGCSSHLVLLRDDGTVEVLDGDGARIAHRGPDRRSPTAFAAWTGGGRERPVVLWPCGEELAVWAPEAGGAPVDLRALPSASGRAAPRTMLAAVTGTGRLVALAGEALWYSYLDADAPWRRVAAAGEDVVGLAVGGPSGGETVWSVDARGRVTTTSLSGPGSRPSLPWPIDAPPSHRAPLSVAPDGGSAVMLDVARGLHVRGGAWRLPPAASRVPRAVRAVAFTGRYLVVLGHDPEGSFVGACASGGDGLVMRTLDDEPVAVVAVSPDDVVIARRCGLLALHLPALVAENGAQDTRGVDE